VKLEQLPTPALLLNLDVMERNLSKMACFFAKGKARLRPHYKNHKSPVLARRQLEAGAIGLTCATLSEAEALVANGFQDILISSELAGAVSIKRFVELARTVDVKTVVDNEHCVTQLGGAARSSGCRPGVLVNVNVGQNRTGVAPGKAAVDLMRRIDAEGLRFDGLMGYEGHVAHLPEGAEKDEAYDAAMSKLAATLAALAAEGGRPKIVSTGGTGTHHLSRRFEFITESQAGSYLLMDSYYAATCNDFECALSVLGTVISKTEPDRVVVNVGLKSISGERGLPEVKSHSGLRVRKLNAEHGILEILESPVSVKAGDLLELSVQYSDATVNLHDRMYGIRNKEVEEILTLQG
jgi:D-serine deaminase-like pyridoxal phosphate-dependent protein